MFYLCHFNKSDRCWLSREQYKKRYNALIERSKKKFIHANMISAIVIGRLPVINNRLGPAINQYTQSYTNQRLCVASTRLRRGAQAANAVMYYAVQLCLKCSDWLIKNDQSITDQ